MRRGHSSRLVLIYTAILGLALLGETAVPQSSPHRAPGKDDETAAPVLNPAIYHHVAQVIWVVGDLDRVVEYWQRLGVHNVHRDGVVSFPNLTYRGTPDPATAKQVTANIGELEIKSGNAASGRVGLSALQKEARDKGYLSIARQAAAAIS